jgi:uncharacterized hydrophobic protein (TIGR00271 family)
VLQLRVFGDVSTLDRLGTWLTSSGRGEHAVLTPAQHQVHTGLLTADIDGEAAQDVLAHLDAVGVRPPDIALLRVDNIGPAVPGSRAASLIWPDMVGMAWRNARPLGRYLVFMAVAGIIAGYGVITINDTLIVGAMAVSPDTLPLVSACVGIVGHRWPLALRAIGTLALGLGVTGLAAASVGRLMDLRHGSSTFSATSPGLSGLVTVGFGTIGVALAAGIAAMLALETRASSAVGVAISVTTIPAAAYFGVAVTVNQYSRADGALAVLGVNVAMLLIGGTVTLALQRWLYGRRAAATPEKRDA